MAVVQRPPSTSGTSNQPDPTDADLLFRQAKQRERRRRLVWLGLVVIVVGTVAAVVAASRSTPKSSPDRAKVSSPRVTRVAAAGAIVAPEHPYGMAVSLDGTLYVIDSARDQILRLTSDGQFQVVAGNEQPRLLRRRRPGN